MNLSAADILVGALTIYGEARGDTQEGRAAVAHTILNRCKARKWWGKDVSGVAEDHSISAVCLKPMQFSCWNKSDPNFDKLIHMEQLGWLNMSDKAFRSCLKALLDAVDAFVSDHTQGSTHYLTTSLHKSGKAPEWSKRGDYIEIGKHRFFKGID